MPDYGKNLGDVALNLKRDWDRNRMPDKKLAMVMVGHKDGVPDAYLKNEPSKRHQFRWIEPKRTDDIDMFQTEGYKFVNKEEWEKTDLLWNWNAEGRLVGVAGHLMARDGALYFAEVAAREQAAGIDSEDDAALAAAERAGVSVTDLEGNVVRRKPGRPPGRPRASV